jgi:nickel-dependent lactate racemase
MKVHLSYGRDGLDVDVPDDATVVRPTELPGLPDEQGAIVDALRSPLSGPPLSRLVAPGQRVAVVFPDLTRPMPNRTVLPPLLAELARLGAGPDAVTLICSTGSHRQATPAEMEALVGADIVARYRIVDHDSEGGDNVEVGSVDDTPILLDRAYVEADVRIVTGFVEPHFFAGFSGGPKAVCPGVAALSTILEAHNPWRIADPAATWTVTIGNPVHDFVRAACALLPPTLSVDVTINRERQVTGVFVGPLPDTHEMATAAVQRTAVQQVAEAFDVVVTTNSGAPLDLNLYQCTKGLSAAARIVKQGGTIILAAGCHDGLPEGSGFHDLLAESTTPDELADATRPPQLDRWASQILGRALLQAEIWMYSDGLSDEHMKVAQLRKIDDVGVAINDALAKAGPGATLCLLPEGPQTVASITPEAATV